MDRGAWWATVHGVAKELETTWQLNSESFSLSLGCQQTLGKQRQVWVVEAPDGLVLGVPPWRGSPCRGRDRHAQESWHG